jgi:hypothetical protein
MELDQWERLMKNWIDERMIIKVGNMQSNVWKNHKTFKIWMGWKGIW